MSKHSEAFEALLTLQRYCENRDCDDCCFNLDGYCPFDTHYVCVKYIADDLHEELSKRVYFLEQLEIEKHDLPFCGRPQDGSSPKKDGE